MQPNGIDVSMPCLVRIEFRGAVQLPKRLVETLQAHEHQTKRMVQSRVLRSCSDRGT